MANVVIMHLKKHDDNDDDIFPDKYSRNVFSRLIAKVDDNKGNNILYVDNDVNE